MQLIKGNETNASIFTEHRYQADSIMRRGGKRAAVLALILLLVLSHIHSSSLHWSWNNEDTSVEYFRYQKNSERNGGWRVVDFSMREVYLPFSGDDTLFVQASYDGSSWSESGSLRFTEYPLFSLRLNISPFSQAFWLFYNGYDTQSSKTRTGAVYGFSSSLEFDYAPFKWMSLYPEAGYTLALKGETIVPGEKTVHYLKAGAGLDLTLVIHREAELYAGFFGGVMMHINNRRYNLTPYFGGRAGIEFRLSDHFMVGTQLSASFALLKAEESLNDSLTLLIAPVSVSLSYIF